MTDLDIDALRLNRRQAAKQATRARVLAAAEALFKAGGYADATIRSIARTMEMSTGAVFANFGSKAEVWTAVFGGPPPSAEVADEIARVLGELPQAIWSLTHVDGPPPTEAEIREHLAGRNLACWCPLDGQPCHADVLLELANS